MATKEEVRMRNWNYARLLGFGLNTNILTEEEKVIYASIEELKKKLVANWDFNTEKFVGHPLKPFKCHWCGKRSNKEYRLVDPITNKEENWCYKHYHEMNNFNDSI